MVRLRGFGVKKIITGEFASADVPLVLVVAAALVTADGRVLVQQRPAGKSMAGLWEFPGGKCERGETPRHALVRELHEELGVSVAPDDLVPLNFVTEPLGSSHLVLLLYVCEKWGGIASPLHASAMQWTAANELHMLPMPPADVSLVKELERLCAP